MERLLNKLGEAEARCRGLIHNLTGLTANKVFCLCVNVLDSLPSLTEPT